jgi:hypothetical protein
MNCSRVHETWWQQHSLSRLAEGETLDASDYEVTAAGRLRPIAPGRQPVRLVAVREVRNANALVGEQSLTFASGLTVAYGDNGSGKSGYARLLKRSVRARHREELLPDIFKASGGPTAAVIDYVDDEPRTAGWDEEAPALGRVAFYEKCGDCYVSIEAEVTYRPRGLELLDALITVCDGVREALDRRIASNRAATVALPALPDATESASFLAALTGSTSDEAIEAACSFSLSSRAPS